MKLSVILLTWNSANDVASCIDSVLEATAHLNREVIHRLLKPYMAAHRI